MLNIDDCKSFSTEVHLRRALEKLGFANHFQLVVCNRKGRFTAVFPASNCTDGDMTRYARHGFMTLG